MYFMHLQKEQFDGASDAQHKLQETLQGNLGLVIQIDISDAAHA